jgi:DNA-directed RNA polymerase subunit RPC12/RpoP
MEPACPKCSRKLPEVKTLKYRFCPHCGAEIAYGPDKQKEAFRTIPPDLATPLSTSPPENARLDMETGKNPNPAGQLNDPAIVPQPRSSRLQPKLKPPDTPPPAGFFRTPSQTPKPPAQDVTAPSQTKNLNKIIIIALISLAVIILIIGGLFTF